MDKCVDATVAPDGSMRAASASAPLPQAASDVRPISMTTVIVRVLAEAGPTAACRRSGVSRVIRPSEASAPETARAHHRPGHFAFLASGAVWLSFAFFLLTTMAFGILQNFAPAILSHVYGVSLIVASGGLTAYLVGSGTGVLAAGFLKDRADRIVAPALGFAAVMAAVLASGEMPSVALWPLMVGPGFGVGFAGPGRDLLVRRAATCRLGRSSFGRVYGFVYSGLAPGRHSRHSCSGPSSMPVIFDDRWSPLLCCRRPHCLPHCA